MPADRWDEFLQAIDKFGREPREKTAGKLGNLAEPDDDVALLLDNELTKFFRRTQIGVGDEVHRDHGPFCSPERRQIIIAR